MSDDIATELVKKLPAEKIYDDAVSPAAREVGSFGADLLKTVRLALFPFQFAAAAQDRLRDFIDRSVRRVPDERRIAPPPQILGPVLEGIRYEPEGTPIDDMFSALLSASMDSERVDKAHPAFPRLIQHLSRDEAVILRELSARSFTTISTFDVNPAARQDPLQPPWINFQVEKELGFPVDALFFPDRFQFFVNHLYHLGLVHFRETRPQERIPPGIEKQTGTRKFEIFELQQLGRALTDACRLQVD